MKKILIILLCAAAVAISVDLSAQSADGSSWQVLIPKGKKVSIKGIIVRRDPDGFVMKDKKGGEVTIALKAYPVVTKKKHNPFRHAQNYDSTVLLRGAVVEVEGKGDGSNVLLADKIEMEEADAEFSSRLAASVEPLESKMSATEKRIAEHEKRIAKTEAMTSENEKRIENLKNGLDDYDNKHTALVNFKVNSSELDKAAIAALNEAVLKTKNERGYLIEIKGFASSDGNTDYNRQLSIQRADAVVRYFVEMQNIPLRRIVTPYGYGENKPVADNETEDGRVQNRRVEVNILINRGLAGSQ
jgi:outer membrane protein OmpA-like peptidoglycan-associated protein